MRKYLIAALAIVLLIAGTNYWMDPAGLSSNGREQVIAGIVLSGKNAAVPSSQVDFEERRLMRELALGMQERHSTIAFGSSRFHYYSSAYSSDPSFFNHAINAATLEDLYTLYWYYKEKGLLPNRMQILLDPWMIDAEVSYVQLINLAYANDFVHASRSLGLTMTDNDKAVFASAIAEVDKNPDTAIYPLSVPDGSVLSAAGSMDQATVTSFSVPEDGDYELTFEARITPGTYYYNVDVKSDTGRTLMSGSYLGPLADNQSPSVHEFRTFRVSGFAGKQGEKVSIVMSSATGDGETAPGSNQNLEVRAVELRRSCSEGVNPISTFNLACITARTAREANRFAWIRELFSPAYFQQSLGLVGQRIRPGGPNESETDQIRSIDECVGQGAYTWCADGSVSPPEGRKTVDEVMDIVRTIDDGLVPLINVDSKQMQNFAKFLEVLDADQVDVELFMMPVHPFMYNKWRDADDQKGFVAAERIFSEFAIAQSVPIFGTYDPARMDMGADCFRDWVHPYPECVKRVLDLTGQ